MRISSASAYQKTIENLQKRQAALVDAQERLSSGKRVAKPSDDPAAAARAERALAAQSRADSARRVVQASRQSTQQAEGALGDANEILQQAREFVISAGSASFSDKERANVADQLGQLRTRLLAIANRDDGAGTPLFGGQGSPATPFVDDGNAPGGVRFDGTPGRMELVAGELLPLSGDGRATWLSARDPATGTEDLSVFKVLGDIADKLRTPGVDGTTNSANVREGLGRIDAAIDHVSTKRALFGETLARADAVEQRLTQAGINAQTERSDAEDLDMVQAISDFQNRQTGYSAALQTYSAVQRMSLFDYLR